MPLVSRTFDQLIDFTRTSSATFVNESGNIASTPQSRNLLTFTNEFANAAWTKTNATIVPNVNPAAGSLGAELVTNGDFASGTTGWSAANSATLSNSSNRLSVVNGATALGQARSTITTVPGRIYRVAATFTSVAGSRGSVFIGTFAGDNSLFSDSPITASRSVTGYFVATGTTTHIAVGVADNTLALEVLFDDISVREVVGGALQAPDGTFTADTLVEDTTNAAHTVSSGNATVALGAVTWSVYAKAGTRSWMWLNAFAGGNNRTWFNLANGTVGTTGAGATASITSVGNGWYRCSVTLTSGTTTVSMGINAASADNTTSYAGTTGAGAIFIWGAQLEQASSATDYTRNFGGLFPPRFDYDPVTRAPRGLLIEEQRTNLLVRSEEFDNASWTKGNGTVTANATTSPDGTVDADSFVSAAATDATFVQQAFTSTAQAYAASVYVKANGVQFVQLLWASGQSTNHVNFDLTNGTIGTNTATSASITAVGNGWYRLTIVSTLAAASGAFNVYCVSASNSARGATFAGNGTSGIFLWGAQLEAGAFATSYIPTVASQVTRTADQAAINAPNFASWYNSVEGTLLVEGTISPNVDSAVGNYYAAISDGTTSNTIHIAEVNGSTSQVITGGVTQFSETVGSEPTGTVKVALAYATNNTVSASNGTLGSTDTSVSIPTVNRLNIGSRGDLVSTGYANGHIRSIRYYPARLSNAQLQALTA